MIVIFLAVTTTYSKYAELKINLPTADANQAEQLPDQIDVAVASDGQYMINRNRIVFTTTTAFAAELQAASGGNPDPVIVISADANATHQSVISIMEAARMAGFGRITFTTQQTQ